MPDQFESFIEDQLRSALQPLVKSAVPPASGHFAAMAATVGGTASMSLGSFLVSALTTKAAAGVAAATLAIGGGGAVAATAVTGSPNPSVWGQQVRAIVTQCKTERASDERGIGHCVASFARTNGEQEKGEHDKASDARTGKTDHGLGNGGVPGNGNGHGNGVGNPHATGSPAVKPGHSPGPEESPEGASPRPAGGTHGSGGGGGNDHGAPPVAPKPTH